MNPRSDRSEFPPLHIARNVPLPGLLLGGLAPRISLACLRAWIGRRRGIPLLLSLALPCLRLGLTLVLGLGLGLGPTRAFAQDQDGSASPGPATAERPNVVLFLLDDLAPAATGAEGDPLARTPMVDRVCAEGTRFSRAYAATPSMVNARYALLTGRPPGANGASLLGTKLHHSRITIPEVFRFHGVRTYCAGDLLEEHTTVPFDEFVPRRAVEPMGLPVAQTPLPAGTRVREPWNPFEDPARVRLHGSFLPVPLVFEDMPEVFLARRAAEFVQRPHDRPFFLCVTLRTPFASHDFPVEYAERFSPEGFELPAPLDPAAGPAGPADAAPPRALPRVNLAPTDDERRGILATYYAAKAFLDDCRAIVLDAIDKAGIADRTLVVVAGETGALRAEQGRFERDSLHEGAIRIALAMRQPGRIPAGVVRDELIEGSDLAPTLFELAGVPLWHRIEGRSFAAAALGNVPAGQPGPAEPDAPGAPGAGRTDAVSVDYEAGAAALTDGRWKLVHTSGRRVGRDLFQPADGAPPGRSTRLYDLASDPDERIDLAGAPEHAERASRMKERLLERLSESPSAPPMPEGASADERLDYALLPPETVARIETELTFTRRP